MPNDKLMLISTPGPGRSWVKEKFLAGPDLAAVIECEVEKDKELLRLLERKPNYLPQQFKMMNDPRPMRIYGGQRRLK